MCYIKCKHDAILNFDIEETLITIVVMVLFLYSPFKHVLINVLGSSITNNMNHIGECSIFPIPYVDSLFYLSYFSLILSQLM